MAGITSTSSTQITSPTGDMGLGHAGQASMAAQGAATGATVGTAFGPVGTAVGAVVGGVVGAIAGAFADRGQIYQRKANKWAKLGKERNASIEVRNAVNNFRQARAMQMALIGSETGGTQSSAPAGAVSSLGSQYVFNMAFAQGQNYIAGKVQKNLKKAGKSGNNAGNIMGGLNAVASIVGSFGGGKASAPTTFGISSNGGMQGLQNQAFSDINTQYGGNYLSNQI